MHKTLDTNSLEDVTALVRQSQAGDRRAFDVLVQRYQVYAMKAAVGILANVDDAAETVQEGFVAAYLKIKRLRDPEKFGSWLLRIMVNCAMDRQKTIIKRRQLFKKAADLSGRASSSYHDAVDTNELQSALQSAMARLTQTQTRAIALFGIEELSHNEVAAVLGCSPEAARWHVHQARKKLKVLLKDYIE